MYTLHNFLIIIIFFVIYFTGAIKNEFFEQLLATVNEKFFEGPVDRRLPKDWGNESNLEMTGIIIAHSVTQGGPGFPYLCPAIVSYMLTLSSEAAINAIPTASDIPLNLSTTDLIDLLSEVFKKLE